jgi:uncharacterized membrane protein
MLEENINGNSTNDDAKENISGKLVQESPNSPFLNPSKLDADSETFRGISVTRMVSGSLPPPEILKAYDLVTPGLSGGIIEMACKQSSHRLKIEETAIIGDNRRSLLGLILGFVIASVSMVSSTFLILKGHDLAGSIMESETLISLVGIFIYGINKRSQERLESQKALLDEDSEE